MKTSVKLNGIHNFHVQEVNVDDVVSSFFRKLFTNVNRPHVRYWVWNLDSIFCLMNNEMKFLHSRKSYRHSWHLNASGLAFYTVPCLKLSYRVFKFCQFVISRNQEIVERFGRSRVSASVSNSDDERICHGCQTSVERWILINWRAVLRDLHILFWGWRRPLSKYSRCKHVSSVTTIGPVKLIVVVTLYHILGL